MSDWFNWTNFFYLAGLILAGGATFVGLRYKKLVDEIKEVFTVLQEAYEDGKLDKDEQKKQALKLFLVKCDYSGDMEHFKQKHDEQKKEKLKAFCRYFEKAQKKGKLPTDADPKLLTYAIGAYMRGIVHEYMDNPARFNMKKDAPKLMSIFFKGLCA